MSYIYHIPYRLYIDIYTIPISQGCIDLFKIPCTHSSKDEDRQAGPAKQRTFGIFSFFTFENTKKITVIHY